MIPQADVSTWRENAPWATDAQVEQDLVLSRALVEIFSEEIVRSHLAFRGERHSISSFLSLQLAIPKTSISSRLTLWG